ncbi:formate hydrogenlyase subunit 6 [Anaerolinea thermolimosa]|uniref:4Fe-4S binding protein n=1 Tax=Anaerolinea thermolimosa TaxID=229919 RepID=UPI000785FA1E|nr:4Fe-4S binding protein [Anaerolinea thermolimosa]GAP06608.1 formate hydrogenlyase subunit 6 [Anaerolinea thermolimosa]
MNGMGVLKGLAVTFRHFIDTYLEDFKAGKKRYFTEEGIRQRASIEAKGIFSIQYPEEKLPVPEEFRYIPFLVYDEGENGERALRCTSCGICAKVCPPQCIWIVRTNDPVTGKPVPAPAEFYIDVDICMNCGYCAEYCPFDAIKMDHNYEIASYDRFKEHIFDLNKLSKPASYYAKIRPANFARETAEREAKAAKKAAP